MSLIRTHMFFLQYFKRRKAIKQDVFSLKLFVWMLLAITLHIFIFVQYEKVSYFDALWVTLTTIFTVGYGDLYAKTIEGRVATMILLYGGGVFIIAKVISDWFEYLSMKLNKKLKGIWSYKMKNHIVIINHPENYPNVFIGGLIDEISKDSQFEKTEIILVSPLAELPTALAEKKIKWVQGHINDMDSLNKANIMDAQAVYIFANNACDNSFDSYAFDIIDNIREKGCKAYIITECVKTENKNRLIRNGADAVIKVMHGYPSVASRALTAKGSHEVLENLFSDENEECIRIDISNPTLKSWKEIVMYCLDQDIGTAIACIDEQHNILTSPIGKTITATSLFVISHSKSSKSNSIKMSW